MFAFVTCIFLLLSSTFAFDFIVIGGGASGCALAAGLASKGKTLLLERGKPQEDEPLSQNAAGWPGILADIGSFDDAAEDIRTTEGVWTIAPRILGGGTSLNVGVWIRENEDFFSGLGISLNWTQVQSSYSAVESALGIEPNPRTALGTNLRTAFSETEGFASGNTSVSRLDNTTHFTYSTFQETGQRLRHGAATLLPLSNSNLVVLTRHRVNSIIFSNANPPRAIGVDVSNVTNLGSFRVRLNNGGRIFLSAGAIHSPVILQRSGVAPSNVDLSNWNIQRVAINDQVGKNFIDKPVTPISIFTNTSIPQTMVELVANSESYVLAQTSGGNIISSLAPVSAAFMEPSGRTPLSRFAIEIILNLLGQGIKDFLDQSFQIITFIPSPASRGEVTLGETKFSPSITAGYYSNSSDLDWHVTNLQRTYQILQHPALASLVQDANLVYNNTNLLNDYLNNDNETAGHNSVVSYSTLPPLFNASNPDDIRAWVQKNYVASYHSAGSLSLAVDSNLDLLNVTNIKVVDASVLKISPRTHPQATLVMLGHYWANQIPACTNNCNINCDQGSWSSSLKTCVCNRFWFKNPNCAGNPTYCPCSCTIFGCN